MAEEGSLLPAIDGEEPSVQAEAKAEEKPKAAAQSAPAAAPVVVVEKRQLWAADAERIGPSKRRPWPRSWKIGAGAGGLLLGLMTMGRFVGAGEQKEERLVLATDVVSAEDLKHRRQVKPEDFMGKDRGRVAPTPSPFARAPDLYPAEQKGQELAERHARREADPEDIARNRRLPSTRAVPAVAPTSEPAPEPEVNEWDRELYLEPERSSRAEPKIDNQAKVLVPAGSSIPAVLTSAVELGGGTSTVVAIVEKSGQLPAGTRFIGSASLSRDRASMRFRTVVFPDGREGRVNAEGQEQDGTFGLAVDVQEPEERSVGRDVAGDTAVDVIEGAIGRTLVGRAAGSYVTESERRGRRVPRAATRASLPAGTAVMVFMHEAVRGDEASGGGGMRR